MLLLRTLLAWTVTFTNLKLNFYLFSEPTPASLIQFQLFTTGHVLRKHFNGHFPGGPGLASTRIMNVSIVDFIGDGCNKWSY